MKLRYFFGTAAILILVIMFLGFQPFYFKGEGMGGRKIAADLFPLVLVHGLAMTAWVVLFLVQTLLIAGRNRKLHMALGWSAIPVALAVAVTGFMLAMQSVQPVPLLRFWGMDYRQFLLLMLTEVTMYVMFVAAGIATRERPQVHRAMMLLASLSTLPGATARMPVFFPLFGEGAPMGIFGPIFAFGMLLLVARSVQRGSLDRAFAAGYALLVVVYVAVSKFALSEMWSQWARDVLRT